MAEFSMCLENFGEKDAESFYNLSKLALYQVKPVLSRRKLLCLKEGTFSM